MLVRPIPENFNGYQFIEEARVTGAGLDLLGLVFIQASELCLMVDDISANTAIIDGALIAHVANPSYDFTTLRTEERARARASS